MAMRKSASVSLTFAGQMVNIPVGLYKATSPKDIAFNNLHRNQVALDDKGNWVAVTDDDGKPIECGSKIKTKRYCPTCNPAGDGPELAKEDLVKGYAVTKDSFVRLEESDFEAVPIDTLKAVEIQEFVGAEELDDPRYYEESYFLAPDATGAKIFSLLYQAAEAQDKIAICKLVLREKEHIAALRPFQDGVMILSMLYFADEVKDHSELKQNRVAASEKELSMAMKLVEALTVSELDLAKYHDNYREALTELIGKKANGEVIAPREKAAVPSGDGMDLFEKALNDIVAKKAESKT